MKLLINSETRRWLSICLLFFLIVWLCACKLSFSFDTDGSSNSSGNSGEGVGMNPTFEWLSNLALPSFPIVWLLMSVGYVPWKIFSKNKDKDFIAYIERWFSGPGLAFILSIPLAFFLAIILAILMSAGVIPIMGLPEGAYFVG